MGLSASTLRGMDFRSTAAHEEVFVRTPDWVRDAIFYQVFPDRLARSGRVEPPGQLEAWEATPTFDGFKGGDLYGVVAHLDRLRRLGITALYLNPVFTSAANHRYHTDDYYNVDPLLGGNAALRELLDEAHARDIRVVLDGVFNHCGRGWWPFHHVAENGMGSPYRDWFHLAEDVRQGTRGIHPFPTHDQLAQIDALHAEGTEFGLASRAVLGYEAWWDLPALPKLHLDEPHLRELILDVSEHWMRFGIDGWRLDVAEEVGADFWREFHQRVRAVNPEAYLVAEIWHDKPDWLQGDMFDAFMNYPLALAILGFAAQGHLDTTIDVPAEYEGKLRVFDGAGLWRRIERLCSVNDPAVTAVQLNLLDSHDTPRALTICGGDMDALRLATLLQMTLPGAPCLYYGTEVGMEGAMDPFCRGAFPSDPTAWEHEPCAWIADLTALRHSSRAFRDAELSLLEADGPVVAYLRRDEDEAFAVVANASDETRSLELPLPLRAASARAMDLRGPRQAEGSAAVVDGALRATAPPREGMVVRLDG
jgi:cyclomaltodextrinase / maltogenic alpha-amylase / neopullulanase